ncbi:translocation/assembly module TamB, partial [Crocinitomicaceae bacterium]|nr:translocation/assembly module TamB [Crocinitomicaceae bacterium]
RPTTDGTIQLKGGSMFVDVLGVHLGIDGPINIDQDGFYINEIPVFDEEGNSGKIIGAVLHQNFRDFNFDLRVDLESLSNLNPPLEPNAVNKFLVMNLSYSPNVLYHGKGYVSGSANILGYTDNLEVIVDFKTHSGTTINVPMYGIGDIEDEGFITFTNHTSDSAVIMAPPKFDFTGVDLDLNFEVTPAANINIIFNEDLGDVIHARGYGDISISLDNLGDVKMEGVYTVSQGAYDFAMDPINKNAIAIKQKFIIEEGGSISWIGDPYDADLNLRTYYTINANIAEINNDQIGSAVNQPILSFLELTGSMTSPAIGFDIQAPGSTELTKALLSRIKSDPDELNRQFFSLMLFRRFQPIDAGRKSGTGALDLITNQINYMLSSVLSEYNLNLDYDTDLITGDNTLEFGMSKSFLDDRLIVSGSFGIENYGEDANIKDDNGNEIEDQLIGDMKVEYLLNESGSFRVNIFNESTDRTVIQEVDLARFTQGAGLHYKEDFNSFQDFKLIQYFLDIFRKKGDKKYPDKGNHQQRMVPNMNNSTKNNGTPATSENN